MFTPCIRRDFPPTLPFFHNGKVNQTSNSVQGARKANCNRRSGHWILNCSNPARSSTPRSRAHRGITPRPEYSSPLGPRNCAGTDLPALVARLGPPVDSEPLCEAPRALPETEALPLAPNLISSASSSLIRFERISSNLLFAFDTSVWSSSNEYPARSGSLGITDTSVRSVKQQGD